LQSSDFKAIGRRVTEMAIKLGGSAAEAFISRSRELSIEVREQHVETMKLAEEQGLGVRVIKDSQLGFAFTTDLSEAALDQVVRQAVANSASTAEDPYNKLPAPPAGFAPAAASDPEIEAVPVEDKIRLCKEIERQARAFDPRVTITERCAYTDSSYTICIVNSLGLEAEYHGAYCGAYAMLVAEENGEAETGFGFRYSLRYRDLEPAAIAREAAQKAVNMLGATTIPSGEMAAVFDPYVATNFLGLLSTSLSADAVQKGKSRLAGKIGQEVASPLITLVDDGAKEGGIISAPFDGEGVPTRRNVLIDRGNLQGFLYNTYAAGKEGRQSNGAASRGSFKATPEVGTSNYYIENGTIDRDELIRQTGSGIYITHVMGMHTANSISGDFSLGASGFLIEDGRLSRPVRGVAIAGNIFEFIKGIDGLANDLTFFIGQGSPTLRVSKMAVSGS